LSGTGVTGPIVLAVVIKTASSRKAGALLGQTVSYILMVVGAYRVGHSGRTDLFHQKSVWQQKIDYKHQQTKETSNSERRDY